MTALDDLLNLLEQALFWREELFKVQQEIQAAKTWDELRKAHDRFRLVDARFEREVSAPAREKGFLV